MRSFEKNLWVFVGALAFVGCTGGEDDDTTVEPCVEASGNICTLMGQSKAGLGEDGVAPNDPRLLLYLPQDTIVGPDGALYVLDWNNHRVGVSVDGVVEPF